MMCIAIVGHFMMSFLLGPTSNCTVLHLQQKWCETSELAFGEIFFSYKPEKSINLPLLFLCIYTLGCLIVVWVCLFRNLLFFTEFIHIYIP